jgi:hypothetical protein
MTSEAEVRKAAGARGWRLEKQLKVYRVVDTTSGRIVAAD